MLMAEETLRVMVVDPLCKRCDGTGKRRVFNPTGPRVYGGKTRGFFTDDACGCLSARDIVVQAYPMKDKGAA